MKYLKLHTQLQIEIHLKCDEKCFLFHLKVSFHSQDIKVF